MLPARLGESLAEDGGLVLSGFEAFSQYVGATAQADAEPLYPLGALMAVLAVGSRLRPCRRRLCVCFFFGGGGVTLGDGRLEEM